jgi:hypothetical protein
MATTVLTDEDIQPLVEGYLALQKELAELKSRLNRMEGNTPRTHGDMLDARRIISRALGRSEVRMVSARFVGRLLAEGHVPGAQKTGPHNNSPWSIPLAGLEQLAQKITAQPAKFRQLLQEQD